MFRTSMVIGAAILFMGAWPDQAYAQRWRGGRGVYVGTPYASVGVGNYFGGGWYGYSQYPYYGNRGLYGYGSPYYYNRGWYGYPFDGAYAGYPAYSSGNTIGPVNFSNDMTYQTPNGTTTSFYRGPPVLNNQVRVRVILPDANAQLLVGDQMNHANGTERLIVSPTLAIGTNCHYTFRAFLRDANGQEVTREKRIDVIPGQQYTVDFNQT